MHSLSVIAKKLSGFIKKGILPFNTKMVKSKVYAFNTFTDVHKLLQLKKINTEDIL